MMSKVINVDVNSFTHKTNGYNNNNRVNKVTRCVWCVYRWRIDVRPFTNSKRFARARLTFGVHVKIIFGEDDCIGTEGRGVGMEPTTDGNESNPSTVGYL